MTSFVTEGVLVSEEEEFRAVAEMAKIGGGFSSNLAKAWQKADLSNKRKLREAFGPLLLRYVRLTKKGG